MKLRNQILATFIISGLVPFSVAFLFMTWSASTTTSRLVLDSAEHRLFLAATTLEDYFAARQSEVEILAQQPEIRSMDFQAMRPILMDVLSAKADVFEKFIIGRKDGTFHNTSGGNPDVGMLQTFDNKSPDAKPKNIRGRDYWQLTVEKPLMTGSYVSNPMISFTTEVKQVVVAAPLKNADGETQGLIGGSLPWSNVNSLMTRLDKDLEGIFPGLAHFALISRDGTYWYHWKSENVIQFARDEGDAYLLDANGEKQTLSINVNDLFETELSEQSVTILSGERVNLTRETDDGRVYHLFMPIGESGYVLELALDNKAMRSETTGIVNALVLAILAAIIVSLISTTALSKRLANPLREFENNIRQRNFSKGKTINFETNTDELNSLFGEFNALITTISESEQQLKSSEERFALAMKGANDGLWDWDLNNNKTYFSPRWKEMLGYEDNELPNDASVWESLIVEEDRDKTRALLEQYLEGKSDTYQVEFRMRHKDGHIVNVLSRGFAARHPESNAPERLIGTHVDITMQKQQEQQLNDLNSNLEQRVEQRTEELKKANDQLQEATEKAAQASEAKSLFLANMSHEIRTPLNGIIGLTDLTLRTELTQKQRDFLEKIQFASGNLVHIVNDILDFSKIEAGKILIEKTTLNLRKMLQDVIQVFNIKAIEKGLKIKIQVDSNIPEIVYGDPIRINQVFSNLVSNAIKFTEKGDVQIGISCCQTQGRVEFNVVDSGIGISAEKQKTLFNDFTQADASTSRKYGGTGLGLAISKRLVELMGGELGMDSHPGEGSRFWFDIPLPAAEAADLDASGKRDQESGADKTLFHGKTALLVEDNEINRLLAKEMLIQVGFQVDEAVNGIEAVQASSERKFDVIVMDIQMPQMDGYAATRLIRSEGLNQPTPIVAMTANAMADDIQKCTDAGMDDHIAKPINLEEAVNVIGQTMARVGAGQIS